MIIDTLHYPTVGHRPSPPNSDTDRSTRITSEELLKTPTVSSACEQDGSRASEAQCARRVVHLHHRSTHSHPTDGRSSWLPQEKPLAAAGELHASRCIRQACSMSMGAWLATWLNSQLGAARSQLYLANTIEFRDRVLCGSMH